MAVQYYALLVAVFSFLLNDCSGNFKLVSGAGFRNNPMAWIEFTPSRGPDNLLEVAVIKSALTGQNLKWQDSDIYFIAQDSVARYVDVVDNSESTDRFAQKRVMRYRIINEKIAAKTNSSSEIFPDPEFERAVLLAAAKANEIDPVLLYEDPVHPVSLLARQKNRCVRVVQVFDTDQTGGKPLAEKMVNSCFTRHGAHSKGRGKGGKLRPQE